jgi:DNA-binding response OmpR family regulator
MQPYPAKGMILVAEDEKELRLLVAEILRDAGYSVLGAADGKSALSIARRHEGPIDLLITDVMMPKLDGFDLREKILLERQKLKVLVMSGALDPEIVGEDFPIIRKPFRPDELISEVDRVLNQSSHRSVA